jgi:hypothetical protein
MASSSTASDVLGVLEKRQFFELLDDRYCPQDDSSALGLPALEAWATDL